MSCTKFDAANQPAIYDHKTTDNVYIKPLFVEKENSFVPQHSHKYAHTTLVAAGSVRVWQDGKLLGDFKAPSYVLIPQETKHTFQTLEPNTLLYCIHNVARSGVIELHDLHELTPGELLKCGAL